MNKRPSWFLAVMWDSPSFWAGCASGLLISSSLVFKVNLCEYLFNQTRDACGLSALRNDLSLSWTMVMLLAWWCILRHLSRKG